MLIKLKFQCYLFFFGSLEGINELNPKAREANAGNYYTLEKRISPVGNRCRAKTLWAMKPVEMELLPVSTQRIIQRLKKASRQWLMA